MSATAPRPDRPDVVLHIGTGKTGTTSIQALLANNRARLAAQGTLYPRSLGRARHTRFGLLVRTDEELDQQIAWHAEGAPSPAQYRRRVLRRLRRELDREHPSRLVISDESLYSLSEPALRRVRRFTDDVAGAVRVVVYLRRQDDHLASRYQQVVKVGEVRRLAERTAAIDFTSTYDYLVRLHAWRDHLQPAHLAVRPFERARFAGGSLYDDFLAAAGLDVRSADLDPVESQNESLDAEAVEFLRVLNIYRVEHEGARAGYIDNRPLLSRLAAGSTGPTLTLPGPDLEAFMARWQSSNRAVAREFLGEDDLFVSPRKSGGTTAEQRLDPERVDHFVDALDLPDHLRRPLREIAEREAGSA